MKNKFNIIILCLILLVLIQFGSSSEGHIEALGDVELGVYDTSISGEEIDYGYSGMGTKLGTKEETTGKGKLLINLLPEENGLRIFSASYEMKTDVPANYEGDPELSIQNWRCSFSTDFDVNKNSIDVGGSCRVCTKDIWYPAPEYKPVKRDYCFTPYTAYIISDNLIKGDELTGSMRTVSPYGSRGPKPYHKFDFRIPLEVEEEEILKCNPECWEDQVCINGNCEVNFEEIDCGESNNEITGGAVWSITGKFIQIDENKDIEEDVMSFGKSLESITGKNVFETPSGLARQNEYTGARNHFEDQKRKSDEIVNKIKTTGRTVGHFLSDIYCYITSSEDEYKNMKFSLEKWDYNLFEELFGYSMYGEKSERLEEMLYHDQFTALHYLLKEAKSNPEVHNELKELFGSTSAEFPDHVSELPELINYLNFKIDRPGFIEEEFPPVLNPREAKEVLYSLEYEEFKEYQNYNNGEKQFFIEGYSESKNKDAIKRIINEVNDITNINPKLKNNFFTTKSKTPIISLVKGDKIQVVNDFSNSRGNFAETAIRKGDEFIFASGPRKGEKVGIIRPGVDFVKID